MDFLALAQARYSVRQFDTKPVEQEKIDLILQAARVSPTAVNYQPQRILVISSEEDLATLKECTPYHFNAPLAFLLCYDETVSWKRKFDNQNMGDIDVAIVGTHMMLEAASLGLGTTWVGHFDPVKIKEAYRLPEHIVPVALFPVGYPAAESEPHPNHTNRHPIDDLIINR